MIIEEVGEVKEREMEVRCSSINTTRNLNVYIVTRNSVPLIVRMVSHAFVHEQCPSFKRPWEDWTELHFIVPQVSRHLFDFHSIDVTYLEV
jgi:hypothetical protein